MIAAGIGCRKDCSPADIISAINLALRQAGLTMHDVNILCAPSFKMPAPEIVAAAKALDRPLVFAELDALARRDTETLTQSPQVAMRFGLSSVAETSALVGAGSPSRLLGPRIASGGATCALATSEFLS
ncbi:MAG: cobalamin biosynthesis protein [Parvibaculaceae bacterium]